MLQAIWDGIAAGGDTVFNMTMLQNIRDNRQLWQLNRKDNGILDYLEQAVFSVSGQAARTIDPIRRSTYDPMRSGSGRRAYRHGSGLSQRLEPALDIWQSNITVAHCNNSSTHGYYKERSDDRVTNELQGCTVNSG